MNPDTVDITELLAHENGRLLYTGSEGCIVRDGCDETVISDITDGDRLCALLQELALPHFDLIEVKSEAAAEKIRSVFGFTGCHPCTQWVYSEKTPPISPSRDIRLLTPEYAEAAGEAYHGETKYIRERIASKHLWGLFENDALAGFIGMHPEGAIGILQVLPPYCRKGYGFALEAFLIGHLLKPGRVPFCHVIDGNEASLRLQKKLGMQCASLPAIWLWKSD